ncbi:MAG TPA: hypothetical protein PKD37_04895 [Oligoflexia bacterium]|nr:hypothetical protein [Oligoflexia bacterium]HMP27303.1 hypothetical protein [Oligoflexia bacterium]
MIRSCKEALADFLISLNPNCTMTAEFGANEDSYEEKRAKAKDEIRETIDPDYIPERRDVTKMTPASLQYAVRLFKEFIHDAENRINGRAFYRLPPEKRIRGVVFPENIHTNIHFHIVANVPERKLFRFCNDAPRYWNQQVKRGSLKASQSLNTSSQKRITKYSSKESYIPENYEHFFFIQDFWGRK